MITKETIVHYYCDKCEKEISQKEAENNEFYVNLRYAGDDVQRVYFSLGTKEICNLNHPSCLCKNCKKQILQEVIRQIGE